ncbi:MAG: hypothetical protein HRU15_18170, partial [Planctomycetes bacterium]|nr:hypothetical protein [Planctomycetota bacterium]
LWKDLAHIGHGDSGKMSCLFVIGQAKSNKDPIPYTAFPPRGFIPRAMFGNHYAWHVSPQKGCYSFDKNASLDIYRVNPKTLKKAGEPIPIQFRNVDHGGYGWAPAIIAQPDKLIINKGDSFWVECTGLTKTKKDAPDINYLVTFY